MLDNQLFAKGFVAAEPHDFSTDKTSIATITIYVHDTVNGQKVSYPLDFTAFGKEAQLLLKYAKKSRVMRFEYAQKNSQSADGTWHNDLNILHHQFINKGHFAERQAQASAQDDDFMNSAKDDMLKQAPKQIAQNSGMNKSDLDKAIDTINKSVNKSVSSTTSGDQGDYSDEAVDDLLDTLA